MRSPRAPAPCLSPLGMSLCTLFGKIPHRPESSRFESSFAGLSRVNDSLIQNKCRPAENCRGESRVNESETGTWRELVSNRRPCGNLLANCEFGARSLGSRRFSVADDPLHCGERATQCALDRIDVLVDLDHAHRGSGAAMKIHDFAGFGVAHPNIVNVIDDAIGGKPRQGFPDRLDAFRRGIAAERQFGFEWLDVGIDLGIRSELVADLSLQVMGNALRFDGGL